MYEFEYHRPESTAGAVELFTHDSRYLAGGQSLLPSMKLRLASAERLIDLTAIDSLRSIVVKGGFVIIGATTSHTTVATSAEIRAVLPGLAELAGSIGDPMVRNVGTLGGSLANADPAACYPAAVLSLNATIQTDRRTIAGDDFFTGLFETALEPEELIVSVSFPIAEQSAYAKLRQPASRFALVGVMVSRNGPSVRVGVTGARDHAFRCTEIENALSTEFSVDALADIELDPSRYNRDLHAGPDYRAAMVVVMARRAVEAAIGP